MSAEHLRKFSVCEGMTEPELERLHAELVHETIDADTVVFSEGDDAEKLYFLEKGAVSIRKRGPDREEVLARLEAPAIFGEMGAVLNDSRSASAVTETEVTFGTLACETFRLWLEEKDDIAVRLVYKILCVTSARIRQVNAKLVELGSSDRIEPKVRAELSEFRRKLFSSWDY